MGVFVHSYEPAVAESPSAAPVSDLGVDISMPGKQGFANRELMPRKC